MPLKKCIGYTINLHLFSNLSNVQKKVVMVTGIVNLFNRQQVLLVGGILSDLVAALS